MFSCYFYTTRRELATELAREVLPQLQGTGTKLLLISIGTPERGKEFAAKTGFPEELLLADPESETYAAVSHIVPTATGNASSSKHAAPHDGATPCALKLIPTPCSRGRHTGVAVSCQQTSAVTLHAAEKHRVALQWSKRLATCPHCWSLW